MTKREQNAVANFLASLDGSVSQHDAYENARMDRKLYKWSDDAMTIVVNGIGDYYARLRQQVMSGGVR